MIENNTQRGKSFNPWHFIWISVVISEVFTATLSVIQHSIFYPETDLWYMLKVGAVDSLFVPLIIAPIVIYFLRSESALKKINTQLENEIAERKRIEEGLLDAKREREKLIADLQKALAEIKTLHGILPICMVCKKILDDKGSWKQMEVYIKEHSEAEFSHGYCPECAKKALEELMNLPKRINHKEWIFTGRTVQNRLGTRNFINMFRENLPITSLRSTKHACPIGENLQKDIDSFKTCR